MLTFEDFHRTKSLELILLKDLHQTENLYSLTPELVSYWNLHYSVIYRQQLLHNQLPASVKGVGDTNFDDYYLTMTSLPAGGEH